MRNVPDRREMMIAQTSAWLTWAMDNDVRVPRIPRHRVDRGGFRELLRLPHARAAVNWWWYRTFQYLDQIG